MFELKMCDNCHRILEHGDKVTVILSDVEVTGRYRKNHEGFRLKLSKDAVESQTRPSKIYCTKCLDMKGHFLKEG